MPLCEWVERGRREERPTGGGTVAAAGVRGGPAWKDACGQGVRAWGSERECGDWPGVVRRPGFTRHGAETRH
jgi:hypothetical protein